jgi:uncharacterized protein (DUF924 family)
VDEKARKILDFWKGLGPKGWWRKDEATDSEIGQRFGALVERARWAEFDSWREDPQSCLALVILLDQFSRNIHRGSALAFAGDEKALEIADMALARGHDRQVDEALAGFFHLPFMHSERIADQERCVRLVHGARSAGSLEYAILHREVIRRFGRFPHRNPVLGRHTTPAEAEYLASGGFAG